MYWVPRCQKGSSDETKMGFPIENRPADRSGWSLHDNGSAVDAGAILTTVVTNRTAARMGGREIRHPGPRGAGTGFEHVDRRQWRGNRSHSPGELPGQRGLPLFLPGLVTGVPQVGVPDT